MVISKSTQMLFFAIAFVFALLLNAYLFAHQLWGTFLRTGHLSAANQCDDQTAAADAKVNPNKMLFISCGGFID